MDMKIHQTIFNDDELDIKWNEYKNLHLSSRLEPGHKDNNVNTFFPESNALLIFS